MTNITEETKLSIGIAMALLGGLFWIGGLSSQVAAQEKRQDQFREALIRKEQKLDTIIERLSNIEGELKLINKR